MSRVIVLLTGILLASSVIEGACPVKGWRTGEINRTQDLAIIVDGRLDDQIWKRSRQFGDFKLYKGGALAPVQTEVYIIHDMHNLYMGITAYEPNMANIKDLAHADNESVYSDDCIEIMLDADGNAADFYHFVVNSSAHRSQEMRVQTGYVGDLWHNSNWSAAVHKGADRWTVEIAIPWAILNVEQDLINSLRFNVARNRRAGEQPNVESSVANGVFLTPGKFIEYTASDINLTPYRLRYGLFSLTDIEMVDDQLNASVGFEIRNPTQQVADVVMQMALISAEGVRSTTESAVQLAPGSKQALNVPFALSHSGDYMLTLVAFKGDDVVLDVVEAIPIHFVPLKIDVTRPFYRNTLYATENLEQIEATVKIALDTKEIHDATLHVYLEDGTGVQLAETIITNPVTEQQVTFPASKLTPGKNGLRALLVKNGQSLAETRVTIRKLGNAPGNEVRIDEHLNMIINGMPALPIIWWGGAPFEEIARTGSDGIIVGFTENPRPALDELQAAGQMGSVVLMGVNTAKKLMIGKTEYTHEMHQYVQNIVSAVKDHPAMLCYYLSDEPEVRNISAGLLQAYYQDLRELDPYHPVLITNDSPRGLNTYLACHDMFMPDPYILPVKGGGLQRDMDYITLFMEIMRETGKGRKLLGMTPQVFNYGDYGQHNGRAPSFVEQRCQQYLGIVYGVRFFNYYIYKKMKGYPELEIGVPELMKEIRAVTPVLLNGVPDASVATDKKEGIHLAAWRYQGAQYVIACNTMPRAIEVNITMAEMKKVFVVSEDRHITVDNGMFRDNFEPHGVHIYTTNRDFRSPVNLVKLRKRIEDAGGTYRVTY